MLDFEHIQFHLPRFEPPPGFRDTLDLPAPPRPGGAAPAVPASDARRSRSGWTFELDVIARMGFPGYFLVVKDIIDFARSRGIPVGPGRGSAAGCLVLYCLGITDIDPLRYGLLFERFLTTERVTLPDVDVDFSDARRQEVIDYIRKRYGSDSVAQIITFGTMQARAAVRDVGRVLDIPIGDVDRIAKLIPQNMELEPALKTSAELREAVAERPEFEDMMAIATQARGAEPARLDPRLRGGHRAPAADRPRPAVQDGRRRRLHAVRHVLAGGRRAAEDGHPRPAHADGGRGGGPAGPGQGRRASTSRRCRSTMPATFKLLQRADTVGVFQLESAGMRDLCRQMMPDRHRAHHRA